MTPSMRAQAEIDKAFQELQVERGILIMPGTYQAVLDAATKAAYDSAEYEIDKARKDNREAGALERIADVLEAWAGGHFNYYPRSEREK